MGRFTAGSTRRFSWFVCAAVTSLVISVSQLALAQNGDTDTLSTGAPTAVVDVTSERPAPAVATNNSLVASHRQQEIIAANVEGQAQTSIACFALTPDDRILAGCNGSSGEIRVFDVEGKFDESWSLPVQPDAIFARADGTVFIAGEGQLLRLTSGGKVELQKQVPHAAAVLKNPEKLRSDVVAQAKQQAEQFVMQSRQFESMISLADKQIASVKQQLAELEASEKSADADQAAKPDDKESARPARDSQAMLVLKRRLASQEHMKEQYEAAKKQWDEVIKANGATELTNEQIDERVKQSIASLLKASSISATADEVFVATRAAQGYGFDLWRMSNDFENAEAIVSELRGCCGQMDVKANANGLYVAENSQHRVCRYDREGTLLGTWGHGDRTGLEGFGSCCNPMNIAFGPGESVYTAEDNTGRIKRHSLDGRLVGLVGSVDLVPGCKNCSIAVNGDGSRVYMLDITRNHIVRMDGPAVDIAADAATAAAAKPPRGATDAIDSSSPGSGVSSPTGRIIAAGLKALFERDE